MNLGTSSMSDQLDFLARYLEILRLKKLGVLRPLTELPKDCALANFTNSPGYLFFKCPNENPPKPIPPKPITLQQGWAFYSEHYQIAEKTLTFPQRASLDFRDHASQHFTEAPTFGDSQEQNTQF